MGIDETDEDSWRDKTFHSPFINFVHILPIDPDYLARLRSRKIAHLHVIMDPSEEFTCDSCPEAILCMYAFDAYNTDGDCLYVK